MKKFLKNTQAMISYFARRPHPDPRVTQLRKELDELNDLIIRQRRIAAHARKNNDSDWFDMEVALDRLLDRHAEIAEEMKEAYRDAS